MDVWNKWLEVRGVAGAWLTACTTYQFGGCERLLGKLKHLREPHFLFPTVPCADIDQAIKR